MCLCEDKSKGKTAHFRSLLGSSSTRVFEMRTATGRENFACQDSGVAQIFVLIISNGEKILSIVNVVVSKQVKRENNSLPVAVRVSKTCVLKLPIVSYRHLKNTGSINGIRTDDFCDAGAMLFKLSYEA